MKIDDKRRTSKTIEVRSRDRKDAVRYLDKTAPAVKLRMRKDFDEDAC